MPRFLIHSSIYLWLCIWLGATITSGCQCSEKKSPAQGASSGESPSLKETPKEEALSDDNIETEGVTPSQAPAAAASQDVVEPVKTNIPPPWGPKCSMLFKTLESECVEGSHAVILQQCKVFNEQIAQWRTKLGDQRDPNLYTPYESSCESLYSIYRKTRVDLKRGLEKVP